MTDLEELKIAAADALFKRAQLLIARIELTKWQGRLALFKLRWVEVNK